MVPEFGLRDFPVSRDLSSIKDKVSSAILRNPRLFVYSHGAPEWPVLRCAEPRIPLALREVDKILRPMSLVVSDHVESVWKCVKKLALIPSRPCSFEVPGYAAWD